MDFLNRRGYGFLSGFPSLSFTLYTVETVKGCVSLKE
jgi:hypothetical protein